MQGTFPRLTDRAPEGPLPAFAIIFLYKDGAAYQKMWKRRENLRGKLKRNGYSRVENFVENVNNSL